MTFSDETIYEALRVHLARPCDAFAMAAQDFSITALEMRRPSVLFRPALSIDGDQWCALYGDNLQDGLAGFGDTPAQAMVDFDAAFLKATVRGTE